MLTLTIYIFRYDISTGIRHDIIILWLGANCHLMHDDAILCTLKPSKGHREGIGQQLVVNVHLPMWTVSYHTSLVSWY